MHRSLRFSRVPRPSVQIAKSTIWILALLTAGCSTTQKNKTAAITNQKTIRQLSQMRQTLRRQQILIEDLREKNQILEVRSAGVKPQKQISDEPGVAVVRPDLVVVPPPKVELGVLNLRADAPANGSGHAAVNVSGDQLAYDKVLEAYAKHDSREIELATENLLRSSPDSVYADNALYLAGKLALEKQDRPVALRFLNRLLRDYPSGNKAVSALFLRSIVQKQMGSFERAKSDLQSVAKLYPGSPEAQRVRLELKTYAKATPSQDSASKGM